MIGGALAAGWVMAAAAGPCSRAALETLPARMIDADNRRDLEAITALYSDDAMWFSPGREVVAGRARIRQQYERLFESRLELSAIVAGSAHRHETGTVWGLTSGSVWSREGRTRAVHDRFAIAARCEAGEWKVVLLTWHAHDPAD